MPKTLLYIGEDRATLADLMFLPGGLARAATIPDARRLLLRGDDTGGSGYFIAYGADVAARYADDCDGLAAPLGGAWGAPILLLHGPHGDGMKRAAHRLRVPGWDARIVSLPDDWDWLLAVLADEPATRGPR